MTPIDIKALPFSAKAGLCWSFFWRGTAITVGSIVCGALLGGIVGAVFGFIGLPSGPIRVVAGLLGLAVGLASFYVYIRWLLTSRLGGYRLALIEA